MNLNSIWVSLFPLFLFNVVLLGTVLAFRPVYRRQATMRETADRHTSKLLNRWMHEYWLWLTDPFVRLFIRVKLSPNTLTFIGVLIGMASGFFFWKGHFGLGGWCMIFGATFDIFDGRVARATNQETKSGAYFDSVMDRVSEGAFFIGLSFYYRHSWALLLVLVACLGSFMVSYTRSKGDEMGAVYHGGAMQRPERIVYLGVGAIFAPVFGMILHLIWLPQTSYQIIADYLYLFPLAFVALMTWLTSFERIKNVMKILDEKSPSSSPRA